MGAIQSRRHEDVVLLGDDPELHTCATDRAGDRPPSVIALTAKKTPHAGTLDVRKFLPQMGHDITAEVHHELGADMASGMGGADKVFARLEGYGRSSHREGSSGARNVCSQGARFIPSARDEILAFINSMTL